MQCATCRLPLPAGRTCPLCDEDQLMARLRQEPMAAELAPVLGAATDAGLAPSLAPRVLELKPSRGWWRELERAPAGSTVRLQAARYPLEAEVALPPAISLEGAGATLVGGSLRYAGPGILVLSALKFEPAQGAWQRLFGPAPASPLRLHGPFHLRGCEVRSNWVMADAPGTVQGCTFQDAGLAAQAHLWLEDVRFLGATAGLEVQRGRLAAWSCLFERNALGVRWAEGGLELPEHVAGCLLTACRFRHNDENWRITPPWRARWTDNQYERG